MAQQRREKKPTQLDPTLRDLNRLESRVETLEDTVDSQGRALAANTEALRRLNAEVERLRQKP